MNNDEALIAAMAQRWYGFGSWDAPFWFIGLEPGAADDKPDYLLRCANAWNRSGGTELVDCVAYHRELGFTKWHELPRPPLQPTWRALIRLLLVVQNGSAAREEVRAYQRSHWGMMKGETAVLELSSLAARNLRTDRDRSTYLLQRVTSLRSRIQEHLPKLVVMYGLGHAEQWTAMAGMKLEPGRPERRGGTTILLAPHPQTRGMSNADWERLGHACR